MTQAFTLKKPWQKMALFITMTILVVLCSLWAAIPSLTKWAANQYLADYDAELTAAEIDPDLFPIGLTLADVSITANDQQTLSLDEFSVGLDFWPLFVGAFHVNHLRLDGFSLDVSEKEQTWNIAGVPLAAQTQDASAPKTPTEEEDSAHPIVPTFFVRNAAIDNAALNLHTEAGTDHFAVTRLRINEVSHEMFHWRGVFDLEAKINEGTAKIEGGINADRDQLDANIDIGNVQLSSTDFNHFIPQNKAMFSASDLHLEGQTNATYHFNSPSKLTFTSPLITLDSQQFRFSEQDKNAAWDTLQTRISDVSIEMQTASNISLSADTQLEVSGLTLTSGEHTLKSSSLSFSNTLNATQKGDTLQVKQGDAHLTLAQVNAQSGDNRIVLDNGSVDLTRLLGEISLADVTGNLTGELALSLDGTSAQLAQQSTTQLDALSLSAPINIDLSPASNTVALESLDLSINHATHEQTHRQANVNAFGLQLAQFVVKHSAEGLHVTSKQGDLSLETAHFDSPDVNASVDSVTVNVRDANLQRVDQALDIDAQTAIHSKHLTATLLNLPNQQPDTNVKFEAFDFSNQVSWQQTSEQSVLNAEENHLEMVNTSLDQTGTLTSLLRGVSISNNDITVTLNQGQLSAVNAQDNQVELTQLTSALPNKGTLLDWQTVQIRSTTVGINDRGANADIESINIEALTASEPLSETGLPPLAKFEKLHIKNTELRPEGIQIDAIQFDKLVSGVALSESREMANLLLPSNLQTVSDDTNDDQDKAADTHTEGAQQPRAADKPFYVVINRLDVSPESQFSFSDFGITPALSRVLDIEQLSINNVNTRSQNERAHILLKAKNGLYATIESDVSVVPNAARLTMEATAKIREIELPPVSPYVSNALGYRINSGQLNMDLDLSANAGKLDGNTHIVLRQFDLGGQKNSNAILKVGAIPLNLAVDTLKNRDDNIVLDLPMDGDIANPNFQWQNFFLLPIRQGLYKASSTYLMQTFVPYANVISLVQFAGEQALRLRVEPLMFDYGSSEINTAQGAFLDQLAALMTDRSGAQLRACGFGVLKDLNEESPPETLSTEDQQALLQLANDRSESLKAYLVEAEIKSSRIFLCSPDIDDSNDATPRVELNF